MTKKIVVSIILLAFVVCIGMVFVERNQRSHHRGEPSADIIPLTEETQYPITTERIVFSATNCGDYDGEINKPHLEVQQDGKWYIVKKQQQENETSNLLYVMPGETKEFEIILTTYGQELVPGRYRAVFAFCESDEYLAYQFDLVEV